MHPEDHPLAAALRGLPLPTPPRDGWPRLAADLTRHRRRQRARRLLPLAAAAATGLFALLLALDTQRHVADPAAVIEPPRVASAGETAALDALIAESARLETLLGWIEADELDAQTLAIDIELTEQLGWIDRLLAEPDARPATLDVLWQERVYLLRQRYALGQQALLTSLPSTGDSLVSL
ncbi:MAG: hypothetical protein WCZ65_02935 [Lysobacteraceae bacterium]